MKTKLKITIEVDDTFDNTFRIWNILNEKGAIEINDLFPPETVLIATQWSSNIEAVNTGLRIESGFIKEPKEPKVTEVKFVTEEPLSL